jgi:mRNA interferase MazF
VRFNPQRGREQADHRPAIVVGTDLACQIPNNLAIVIPCTHTDRGLPWHPRVTLGSDSGYAMCDQIKSLDLGRLDRPHPCRAIVDPDQREAIARALRELVIEA